MAVTVLTPPHDQWKTGGPEKPRPGGDHGRLKWQSPSQLARGVLELCQMADIVFLALHGPAGRTDGYRPPLISWAFYGAGLFWAPARHGQGPDQGPDASL